MNGKIKLMLWAVALIAVIAASAAAYGRLAYGQSAEGRLPLTQNPGGEVPQSGVETEQEQEQERSELPAPDFTAVGGGGAEIKLSDLIGEKPAVLNFWASWCPPCKQEMPDFQTVYEDIGDEVVFIMVDLVDGTGRETKEKGEEYIREAGFTFPVYYDVNQEAAAAYAISSIPTTFFIDSDGNLVTMARGAIDETTLRYGIGLLTGGAAD